MLLLNTELPYPPSVNHYWKTGRIFKMAAQSSLVLSRQRPINLSAMLKRLSELLQHQVTD